MIRVEVADHFNEDGFSYGLVHGMADRLRHALDRVGCSEHDEDGHVRLSTQGVAQTPNDIIVEVSGCCDAAIEEVRRIVDEVRHNREHTEPSSGA